MYWWLGQILRLILRTRTVIRNSDRYWWIRQILINEADSDAWTDSRDWNSYWRLLLILILRRVTSHTDTRTGTDTRLGQILRTGTWYWQDWYLNVWYWTDTHRSIAQSTVTRTAVSKRTVTQRANILILNRVKLTVLITTLILHDELILRVSDWYWPRRPGLATTLTLVLWLRFGSDTEN